MPDEVAEAAVARKLVRVAAFRQLQGLSLQLQHLTSGRLTIDSFVLPELKHLRAVQEDEIRAVRAEGGRQVGALRTSNGWKTQLPSRLSDLPLLVVGLDQGAIGVAGMSFSINSLGANIHVRWDKIHRCIRDIKLALKHTEAGIFLRAQLFSAYIYSLNYKPFGTGGFAQQKRRILNVFFVAQFCGLSFMEEVQGPHCQGL